MTREEFRAEQAARQADDRAKLLRDSRKLLEKKGTKFTIDELAKMRGMSVGNTYRHFDSKEEILAFLLEEDLDEVSGTNRIRYEDILDAVMKYLPVEVSSVVKKRLE